MFASSRYCSYSSLPEVGLFETPWIEQIDHCATVSQRSDSAHPYQLFEQIRFNYAPASLFRSQFLLRSSENRFPQLQNNIGNISTTTITMGKLLHKLFHGMLPSWITKLKVSSDHTSPKKLLPFFRASSSSLFSKFLHTSSQSDTTCPDTPSRSQETLAEESNKEQANTTTRSSGSRSEEDEEARQGRCKRKSECLEESHHSQSSRKRWAFKKAKKTAMVSAELPECLCEVVGESSAVVKYAEDPHKELWESMVEMIVGNGLWELGSLECLLYCYLSLNPPTLHDLIEETFLSVLKDLERTSS